MQQDGSTINYCVYEKHVRQHLLDVLDRELGRHRVDNISCAAISNSAARMGASERTLQAVFFFFFATTPVGAQRASAATKSSHQHFPPCAYTCLCLLARAIQNTTFPRKKHSNCSTWMIRNYENEPELLLAANRTLQPARRLQQHKSVSSTERKGRFGMGCTAWFVCQFGTASSNVE